jgi:hypothetical protein
MIAQTAVRYIKLVIISASGSGVIGRITRDRPVSSRSCDCLYSPIYRRPGDQLSGSTNTSSRFLRSDGRIASTSRNAAIPISTADSGRVRNSQSPREINSARRRFSSISGPSTIPSSSGAGSKSCLISQ